MKFALVNSKRVQATPAAKGLCPCCNSELTAKCGEVRINHWAHKGRRKCDPWWENETDWHRSWKNEFPESQQEVIQFNPENNEKHIADVFTDDGWAIEFQHSLIAPEERRSRNSFYEKIIWIVDGTRRKRDFHQFNTLLNEYSYKGEEDGVIAAYFSTERILNEWHDSDSFIFFDFQDTDNSNKLILWFIYPKVFSREVHVRPFPKSVVIKALNCNNFVASQ